ncbi:E3 ubiquitin-protein ligase MARCHF2-like [Centruroides vittatus]|uniref:E3 ubiquitin-protein ligase MARCHF2-like n=1 Tax=Centruroides vittatus TaxID=120091 RepID=UPI003510B5B9
MVSREPSTSLTPIRIDSSKMSDHRSSIDTARMSTVISAISLFSKKFSESNTPRCRICFSSGGGLLSACHCKGSIGLFHNQCLGKWIQSTDNDICEICHARFRVRFLPSNFTDWYRSPNNTQKNSIKTDIALLLVLSLIAITILIICIKEVIFFIKEDNWLLAMCILFFCTILITIFVFQVYVEIIRHIINYEDWLRDNYKVEILPEQEQNELKYSTSFLSIPRRSSFSVGFLNEDERTDYYQIHCI